MLDNKEAIIESIKNVYNLQSQDLEKLNQINSLLNETKDYNPQEKIQAKRLRLSMEIYNRTLLLESLEEKLSNLDNQTTNSTEANNRISQDKSNDKTNNKTSSNPKDYSKNNENKIDKVNIDELFNKAQKILKDPKTKMAIEILKDEIKKASEKSTDKSSEKNKE